MVFRSFQELIILGHLFGSWQDIQMKYVPTSEVSLTFSYLLLS